MNHKITSFLIVVAVVLAGFGARADVYCTATTNNNSGGAEVTYKTPDGFNVVAQSGTGGYSFNPDTAPGHQAFSLQTAVSNSDLVSTAAADNTTGTLRAASAGSSGIAGNRAQIFDDITFHNSTGQPQTITVTWNVEGSLVVTPGQPGRATYHQDMFMTGPGTVLRFSGDGHLEGTAEHSFATYAGEGWISYSCEPRSNAYGGVNCSGTWAVPVGDITLSFYALIDTSLNCTEVGCNNPISSNFGNTGKFGITVPQGVSFTSKGGTLSAGSRMVNIASRAEVHGGDSVEIAGFIVTGSVPKKVIIRGLGPSLADPPFNLSGSLADPVLELHQTNSSGQDVILFTNNNWKDSQQAQIEATTIPPKKDLESAIVRALDPGTYTTVLRGNNNGNGIGLIEVYDLEPGVDSRLANISTRAFINAGDNVLIGGLIGGGSGSDPQILIRAVGPSLSALGVANALQDPVLELHDVNGALLISNDDWQTDQKDAIQATGAAPTDPKESAILTTILPTNYTAIVKGKESGTGVGSVEVYHLQ